MLAARISRRAASATALRYAAWGQPSDVLKAEDVASGKSKLAVHGVAVRMLAAPISPADVNMIEGSYPLGAAPPATAGSEGVGEVTAVGSAVTRLAVGDRVVPAVPGMGTWATELVGASEADLLKIPASLPVEYGAALAGAAMTADRLLEDFGSFAKGDTVVQNGANSSVGQAVVQLARLRGLRTVNVLRDGPGAAEAIERLKKQGGEGTVAVTESFARSAGMRRVLEDIAPPRLALNMTGGDAAVTVGRMLAPGGTLVTYGGMSRQPVAVPTSMLIFKDISLRGFWLSRWNESASLEQKEEILARLAGHAQKGDLKLWLERHPFAEWRRALDRHSEGGRGRKVVLVMDESAK